MTTKQELIDFVNSQDVQDFVGKNYEKYQARWTKGIEKAKNVEKGVQMFSFNLLAFLMLPAWLGYRKLHVAFAAYLFAICGLMLVEIFSGIYIPSSAYTGGFVALSFFVNSLYFAHVKKFFETLNQTHSGDREQLIKKVGGTSIPLAIGYAVLAIILIISTIVGGSMLAESLGIDVAEEYQL